MARPIQRRNKKKKTVSKKGDTETTVNTNMGENQAVQTVKVVIHQPEPEKPKRKRRKKKDSKKDEAIEQLKEELQSYDEVQTQAGDAGVDIPSELGVSPAEASALKTADDIQQFIQVIQQKREAIRQLIAQPPQPVRSPNRFIDIPRPPVMPAVAPQQFIPTQVQPQPLPSFFPPIRQPPAGVRPEIAKQIEELEKAEEAETLKLKKTESIEKFEAKAQRSPAEINTLLGNIEVARKANAGVLSQDQLNNFITKLEEVGIRYNSHFSKLSPRSQALLEPRRQEFINELNVEIKKLKDELRTGAKPLPAPAVKETWKPKNAMGRALIEEYLKLDLDKVEITPSQANILTSALRGIPELTDVDALLKELANQPDPKKRQNAIRETLEAIKEAKAEDVKEEKALEKEAPMKTWQPQSSLGIMLLREYINLDLDKVGTSIATDELVKQSIKRVPQITASDTLIKEIANQPGPKRKQMIVREVLQAIREDQPLIMDVPKEEQKPKPQPEPAPQEVEAEKEADIQKAKIDLTGYVEGTGRKGFKNWGVSVKKALKTIGITDAEIERIGEIPDPNGKKRTVRDILSPARECAPGSRRRGCVVPSAPPAVATPVQPPAKPSKRIIQTTSYAEYTRLQRQYAGSPNVIVQAPMSVIQRQTDIDPRDQADLSASRFRIP
jgi:hypothetical protein